MRFFVINWFEDVELNLRLVCVKLEVGFFGSFRIYFFFL